MSEADAILSEIDSTALTIFTMLTQDAVKNAAGSVQRILQVSSQFLSHEAHDALKNFHALYFGGGDTGNGEAQTTEDDDVSRIFDEASAIVAQGGDVDAGLSKITVDDEREKARLAVSGLQKKLETVIAMEANFRESVGPILSGMQFEDAMNQRINHLEQAWTKIVPALTAANPPFAAIAKEIEAMLSSAQERKTFYEKVLREPPPAQTEERSVWLDFAA